MSLIGTEHSPCFPCWAMLMKYVCIWPRFSRLLFSTGNLHSCCLFSYFSNRSTAYVPRDAHVMVYLHSNMCCAVVYTLRRINELKRQLALTKIFKGSGKMTRADNPKRVQFRQDFSDFSVFFDQRFKGKWLR